jgi:uncharacterized protein YecE (DUF72 family)
LGSCDYTTLGHSADSVVTPDSASLYRGLYWLRVMDVGDLSHIFEPPDSASSPEDGSMKIGAGGWAYLPLEEEDRLRAYSVLFDYVEVNTTFYHVPRLSTVRSWRRRVPPRFTFSVKCNRRATHELGLRPAEETFRVLERMKMTLRLLRSEMLVLQTPPSLAVDERKVREVAALLPCAGLGGTQVFWEARAQNSRDRVKTVRAEMLREGLLPVVDLAREPPVPGSPVAYSRMFGAAAYDVDLLSKIYQRVTGWRGDAAVLTFHGGNMYADALRYKRRFST